MNDVKKVIAERSYKKVYQEGDRVLKVFAESHPKEDVFNEALNQARVEATGLPVPVVQEVKSMDGQWTLAMDFVSGRNMDELMHADAGKKAAYMEQFVDLQLMIHSKKAPLLNKMKDKFTRQIMDNKLLSDSIKFELCSRMESMPNHTKICHGDYNPSNVLVGEDGKLTVIDWAHVTQGNASADAAMTYLLFALKDEGDAETYLDLFCKKTDTEKSYVQKWLPIVAAAQLSKGKNAEKEFLMKWIDVIEYQ